MPPAVSQSGPDVDDALASRYGHPSPKPSRAAQKWSIIAALVLGVLATAWMAFSMSIGELDYDDVGYSIDSPTRASVDYEVTKDFDDTAQCMLHVLDESYAIVGARIVTIGPHEGTTEADRSQYFRTDLRTEHLGVTGIVDSCWLLD